MKYLKKDFFAIFFITILVVIFFARFLSGQYLFFSADEASSDLVDFNYPQRVLLANTLKQGHIPLWTQYQSNGFPFLAEAQSGVFYPINLFLFYFFSSPFAFNWSIITSFLIAGYGMYCYMKKITSSFFIALFIASILPFTGFFIAQLKHVQLLQAASFAPFALFFTESYLQRFKKKFLVGLIATLTTSFLAGHLPTTLTIVLFIVFYFLLRLSDIFKASQERLTPILLFFGSIAMSITLSALQLIPTLEMVSYSTRSTANPSKPLFLPILQLATFLFPFIFGDPSQNTYNSPTGASFWESLGYVGVIPLLLFLLSFFTKIPLKKTFLIILIATFLFIVGIPQKMILFLWEFIPGLSFTRLPSRFFLITTLCILILAGVTLEKRLERKKSILKTVSIALLFLLTLFDLWSLFYFYNGTIEASAWNRLPHSAQFLQKDTSYFRMSTLFQGNSYNKIYQQAKGWRGKNEIYEEAKELLPATINSMYNIPSIHFPNEYFGSFSLGRRSKLSQETFLDAIYQPYSAKLLALQNVKYLITEEELDNKKNPFTLVFERKLPHTTVFIYKNPEVLPRFYFVPNSIIAINDDAALATLKATDFNPKTHVVLEKDVKIPNSALKKSNINPQIIKDTFLQIKTSTDADSFFILTDSYYPGWVATIDGKEAEILKANYAFRALVLPKGKHTITFSYQPFSFLLGIYISSITAVILFVVSFTLSFKPLLFNHKSLNNQHIKTRRKKSIK